MAEERKNHFDRAAETWDTGKERKRLALAIAGGILSLPLHREMEAMEYGCGTGLVGLQISPYVGTLTAIDNSTGMLDVLVEKIKKEKITNVHPLCLNLSRDPLLAQFDLIICAMTLHHIEGTDFILKRFMDLLSPGGFMAIADFDLADGGFHDSTATTAHQHGFERKQLHDRLDELGFEELSDRTVHVFTKPDKEGHEREYSVFLMTGKKNSKT